MTDSISEGALIKVTDAEARNPTCSQTAVRDGSDSVPEEKTESHVITEMTSNSCIDQSAIAAPNKPMTGPWVSLLRVFSTCSTPLDHLLRSVGLCVAIASGAVLPFMILVFGSSVDDFNSFGVGNASPEALYNKLSNNALLFVYLFVGRYVLVYIHALCFGVSGIRATRAFRKQFIKSVIRQDIAYIDSSSLGAIITIISSNVDMVENGITEKIGSLIQAIAMLIAGFAVAFTQQWKLTLVTATSLPVLLAVFYWTFRLGTSSVV